jgi:acyl carrier protein
MMESSLVAPRTEIEGKIATVWQEVLGVQTVGLQDNFFDLGGNSLLMIQLYHRLREVLNAEIVLTDLFQYPTISSLARSLRPQEASPLSVQVVQDRAEKQRQALSRRKQEMLRRTAE